MEDSIWGIQKLQRGIRGAGLFVLFSGISFFYVNLRNFTITEREILNYPDDVKIEVDPFHNINLDSEHQVSKLWRDKYFRNGETELKILGMLSSPFTRAGIPRSANPYSVYPAGTDILFDATKLYKSALGNIFEDEDWGPLEFGIMAKHYERQGKAPYSYHSTYMAHILSNGKMTDPNL